MCPELLAVWLAHPSLGLLDARAELGDACVDERLAELGVFTTGVLVDDVALPPPLPEKALRDVYDVPEWLASDNFVLRWGAGIDEAHAQATLDDLEMAWDVEIERLGYPEPSGTPTYLLNVYVGSTDGNTPSDLGAAGYYTLDDAGHPMLVLSAETVADVEGNRATTSAHEFFHAVQHSMRSLYAFGTGEKGAWWWEATAVWVNTRVNPEASGVNDYLFGWTFFPHLSVNHYQYPDGVLLEGYHAYGAFLFVEHLDSAEVVRRSWAEGDDPDPLVVLDELLGEEGEDVGEVLEDLWPRVLSWDLDDGAAYASAHEGWAEQFPDHDHRVGLELEDGLFLSPDEPCRRYGVSYARYVPSGEQPDLRVRFDGEPLGDGDTAVRWVAEILVEQDGAWSNYPIELENGEGDLVVGDVGDADAIWVMAGALADPTGQEELFAHRIRVDELRACGGCGGGLGGSWVLAGLIAAARRRRRGTPSGGSS